jgi:two-component system, NarL family, nitrate/nitrite sensor histidine kinase NarX
MLDGIRHSLIWRLGIALSLVAFVALFGIVSSVVVAEKLRGAATAINDAGKLRYSTYQAGVTVLEPEVEDAPEQQRMLMAAINRFDRYVQGESIARMIPHDPGDPLRETYAAIGMQWAEEVRPMLLQAINEVPDRALYRELRSKIDGFVLEVDRLVHLLEAQAEAQVRQLSVLQGIFLVVAIAVIVWTVRFLHGNLAAPLRELVAGATAMRRKEFDRRVRHTGQDELGQLGDAFNLMARDLAQSYEQLERRVREKTRALEHSNRSLELIYRSLGQMREGAMVRADYAGTLRELEALLGLGRICLCLLDRDGRRSFQLADSRCEVASAGPLCALTLDPETLGVRRGSLYFAESGSGGGILSTFLQDRDNPLALLRVEVPAAPPPEAWQLQLVEAIAGYLTMAISSQKRAIQGRRLALLEERSAIARELHDSLAQSISYLKIQLLRVRASRRTPERRKEGEAALQDLHEGLNECNRQLRELMTNFRLGIDAESLEVALEEVVADANQSRKRPFVSLENRLAEMELGVNEEVHVLHIVREALCNVRHHAQAERASILLDHWEDGEVRVVIDDNGVGISDTASKRQHFGLAIMRERAEKLGGRLEVGPRPEGGTRVELRFRPEGLSASPGRAQSAVHPEEVA